MTKYAIISSRQRQPRHIVALVDQDFGHEVKDRKGRLIPATFAVVREGTRTEAGWVWAKHSGYQYGGFDGVGDDPDELLARIEAAEIEWAKRTAIIDEMNEATRREVDERTLTQAAMLNKPARESL